MRKVNEAHILLAGFIVFALLGAYPPWIERIDIPYRLHLERRIGHGWLLAPPEARHFGDRGTVQVDWSRLELEWLVLAGIVGVALCATKLKRERSLRPSDCRSVKQPGPDPSQTPQQPVARAEEHQAPPSYQPRYQKLSPASKERVLNGVANWQRVMRQFEVRQQQLPSDKTPEGEK